MNAKPEAVPDMTPEPDENDLFARTSVREPDARAVAVAKAREPQMRALRRILGEVVLGIFPQGLIDSVEKAYVHWQEHPEGYLVTEFDTAQERDDSLAVMRAYCECAGTKGYTIRTETDSPPNVLVWRVQTRRGSKDKG